MKQWKLGLLAAILMTVVHSAWALERDWQGSVGPNVKEKGDWHGSIGLGATVMPEYMGASSYQILPLPTIDAVYKKILFISGTRGIGLQYRTPDNIIVGTRFLYTQGRNNTGKIKNMENLAGSWDGGIFMNYLYGPLFITSDLVAAISQQGHSGAYASLGAAYKLMPSPAWELIPRAGVTYGSSQYMNAYFGVTPSEAAATGFAVYDPGAGFRDISLGLIANYLGLKHWRLYVSGGVNFLLPDANKSAVVSSSDQYRMMTGFAYLF